MKKQERILNNLQQCKELKKTINVNPYYSYEEFLSDGFRYIKAIKEGRMLCVIPSVSKSGMSRTIKFIECAKYKDRYSFRQFWAFFKALGYAEAKGERDCFRISGCGMDMVFHTNYSIMHSLESYGFISDAECRTLAQQTPTLI
jgi:hypothetical protein